MTATIHHGDCLDVLRSMPDNSVHAVICDPPYGLSSTSPDKVTDTIVRWATGDREAVPSTKSGFMGAEWDAFVPPPAVWDECFRVLKPGGHLVAFAGSRTQDLMGISVRMAGFDIRENLAWLYGSGFPKSHDISKAIDKRGGASHLTAEIGNAIKSARESRGWSRKQADEHFCNGSTNWTWFEGRPTGQRPPTPETFAKIVAEWPELADYAAKVAEAERAIIGNKVTGAAMSRNASGVELGTGGTCFGSGQNVVDITAPGTPGAEKWQGWGTALKPGHEPIILAREPFQGTVAANTLTWGTGGLNIDATRIGTQPAGRWPANVVLDPDTAKALDQQSGNLKSGGRPMGGNRSSSATSFKGAASTAPQDEGGASRFFKVVEPDPPFMYAAKAPKKERPAYTNEDGQTVQHATVKPLSIMQWLVRLVTPEGGTVLDPFAGSGTTVEAALIEGFNVIGIEREADYLPLIQQRIDRANDALPMAS